MPTMFWFGSISDPRWPPHVNHDLLPYDMTSYVPSILQVSLSYLLYLQIYEVGGHNPRPGPRRKKKPCLDRVNAIGS